MTALDICQHYAYNKLLRARASTTQPVHTAHLSQGKRLATSSIFTAEYRPSLPEWARKKVLFWTLGISGDISCLKCFLMSYTADSVSPQTESASNEQVRLSAGSGNSLLLE